MCAADRPLEAAMIKKTIVFVIMLGLINFSLPVLAAEIVWPNSTDGTFYLDAARQVKEAYLSVLPTSGTVPARVVVLSLIHI